MLSRTPDLYPESNLSRRLLPKLMRNSQLIHFMNDHHEIVAQHFAQGPVDHGGPAAAVGTKGCPAPAMTKGPWSVRPSAPSASRLGGTSPSANSPHSYL